MNIILLVADDLGWNDLPYFSHPLDWEAPQGAGVPDKGEPTRISAPLNRFAARSLASQTAGAGSVHALGSHDKGADGSFEVIPVDQRALTTHSKTGYVVNHEDCTDTDTNPPVAGDDGLLCLEGRDVLSGFGGMARLAAEGVMFPRFYANSAKCGPSRAALFTGRYPKRTGVTLNHAEVPAHEVTIAEFLKQGCPSGSCRKDGQPTDCPNFRPSGTWSPAPVCYRTGLIGKWHLGSEGGTAPWNQGFDEYFGFGGGSRHYWNKDPLQCSPAPGRCSATSTQLCDVSAPDAEDGCPGSETCEPAGLYVGTQAPTLAATACRTTPGFDPVDDNPDCCAFGGGQGTSRGRYIVKNYLTAQGEQGKDIFKDGTRPCSDDGLTKDADCNYLTRVLRDHARNFIVRSRVSQPYFLTVGFHAPHFGFASPLRTEAHYKSENLTWNQTLGKFEEPVGVEPIKTTSPSGATKYWGIMEELDAAVGHVIKLLDHTGVCEDDPAVGCTTDSDCSQSSPGDGSPEDRCNDEPDNTCTGTCAAIGTCEGSPSDQICRVGGDCTEQGSTGTCLPMRERTLVLFMSDHGRPPFKSDYGDPDLRGGKGSIYEGGMRVGLLARNKTGTYRCSITNELCDPASPSCPGSETCEIGVVSPAISSIVDVFATVAEAAGYSPNDNGHYKLRSGYCQNEPDKPCQQNADCGGSNVCGVDHIVDGESFYDTLVNPFNTGNEMRKEREFVYASYPGDGLAAVASDTAFVDNGLSGPRHVCGYESALSTAGTRRVRGGSCVACESGNPAPCADDPADPNDPFAWCKVPGSVCVDADSLTCTSDLDGDGDTKELCISTVVDPDDADTGLFSCRRTPDCPTGSGNLQCARDVYVKCNQCMPATWKIRVKDSGDLADLYDLNTNPTEDAALNCAVVPAGQGYKGQLESAFKTETDGAKLVGGPNTWKACVESSSCMQPY